MVKQELGDAIDVEWRPFSLEQVNQKVGEEYQVWSEPEEKIPPGIWGLRAGIAARRQGKEQRDRFLLALLRARHVDRRDLGGREVLTEMAQEVGLDMARFIKDLDDRSAVQEIAESHRQAVEEHGVFGTPTFIFPGGGSAFLKMLKPKSTQEAAKSYSTLLELMQNEMLVGEVKRPQPPWPQGGWSSVSS